MARMRKRKRKRKKSKKTKVKGFYERTSKDLSFQSREDRKLFERMSQKQDSEPFIYAYDHDWQDDQVVEELADVDTQLVMPIQAADLKSLNIAMLTNTLRIADKAIGGLVPTISGYEFDGRGLWVIPEFVMWSKKAHAEVPHWVHLLSRGSASGFAVKYYGALAGVTVQKRIGRGKTSQEIVELDADNLMRVIHQSLIEDQWVADQFGVVDVKIYNDNYVKWATNLFMGLR